MTDFEIDMLLEDIESGEIINKNKRDTVRIKSLQDGGTYIVRFNENLSCKQVNMLLSELRLHLVGRNVRILPEMPQYFEFVREPVEKIK